MTKPQADAAQEWEWLWDWDLEGLVESDWPPLAASDKIEECRFFLGLMKTTTDWKQFRWLTSAFLEAARAAMDWMAYAAHHYSPYQDDEGVRVMDDCYVVPLSKYMITHRSGSKVFVQPVHPLLKVLCKRRTQTAHYGSLWIAPEKASSPSDFIFKEGGKKEGDQNVLQFCEEVLDLLAAIPHDLHDEVEAKDSE